VCEIIDTELPVPPTGKPACVLGYQRLDLGRVADHELDVAADGEAHMAFGAAVGDVAQLADGVRPSAAACRRARPHLVAAVRDVVQPPGRSW
jgi:hypothetical protein